MSRLWKIRYWLAKRLLPPIFEIQMDPGSDNFRGFEDATYFLLMDMAREKGEQKGIDYIEGWNEGIIK